MTKIATLGPSLRLIVFQFLVRADQVPAVLPPKRDTSKPTVLLDLSGVEVMPSTPDVFLADFAGGIRRDLVNGYELVDAWKRKRADDRSAVRYIFCHRDFIKELNSEFVAKRDELVGSLANLVSDNLWRAQAHLNPYIEEGAVTGDEVLMISCTGRNPRLDSSGQERAIYEGGRDGFGQGIGRRISITLLSPKLVVGEGSVILLN